MTQGELPKNKGEYTINKIKIRSKEMKRDISLLFIILILITDIY